MNDNYHGDEQEQYINERAHKEAYEDEHSDDWKYGDEE